MFVVPAEQVRQRPPRVNACSRYEQIVRNCNEAVIIIYFLLCMSAYVHVHMYRRMRNVYMHAFSCIYLSVSVCICMHVCLYVCMYICRYICINVYKLCMSVRLYVSMYVCLRVYI